MTGRPSWAAGGQGPVQLCPLGLSPGMCRVPSGLAVSTVSRGMHRAPMESRGLWKTTREVSGGQKCGQKVRSSFL